MITRLPDHEPEVMIARLRELLDWLESPAKDMRISRADIAKLEIAASCLGDIRHCAEIGAHERR